MSAMNEFGFPPTGSAEARSAVGGGSVGGQAAARDDVVTTLASRTNPAGRGEGPSVSELYEIGVAVAQRGVRNLRRHWIVDTVRSGALLVGDVATLLVLRLALRTLVSAEIVSDLVPSAWLYGWSLPVALVVGLTMAGAYGAGERRRDSGRIIGGVALAGLFSSYPSIWTGSTDLVLSHLLVTGATLGVAIKLVRSAVSRLADRFIPLLAHRVIVVGSTDPSGDPPVTPSNLRGAPIRVVGWVGIPDEDGHDLEPPAARLGQMIHELGADTVILRRPLRDADFTSVIDQALASGCLLLAGSRAVRVAGAQPRPVWFYGESFVRLTSPHMKGWQLFQKRVIDILGALAGLLLLSPVLLVVAACVKLDSPGPVLFGHKRLGVRGRPFQCYKFRSMRRDAEEILRNDTGMYSKYVANNFKIPEHEDQRITRVGRFLRRTSLDELPQLLNVLTGQMSLVGPRPIVVEELRHYGDSSSLFLSVKPGMTGVWAVNGRSAVGYPNRANMELQYIRRWSLLDDLSILVRTIPAVFEGEGAN